MPIAGIPSQENAHNAADAAVDEFLQMLNDKQRIDIGRGGMAVQVEKLRSAVREMFWIDWSDF